MLSKKDSLLLFLATVLIIIRFETSIPKYPQGKMVRVTGKVLQEPNYFGDTQGIDLWGLKVYLPLYPKIYYGDEVVVEGLVDGKKIKGAKLVTVKESGNFLFSLRKKIISFYQKSLPPKAFGLVSGMVLGSKEGITSSFWGELKNSGTAHVVVASGMNIAFIGGFLLESLLLFLGRKKAVFVTVLGIWIYSFMAGFEAPIIRAAIMGTVLFGAQGIGRENQALRSLIICAILMLLIKPQWLVDLGFLLSFAATTSLMLFGNKLEKFLKFVPRLFREGLSTSLAAQIGVFPILYYAFGSFNPLSPLINAAILWVVAPVTILGMVSGIISLFVPQIARLILFVSYPLIWWFIKVVEVFA